MDGALLESVQKHFQKETLISMVKSTPLTRQVNPYLGNSGTVTEISFFQRNFYYSFFDDGIS